MSQAFRAFDFSLRLVVAALTIVLALVGGAQVFFRYVMESALYWTEEVSRYLMIWLVFIAAGIAVERGTHISVDILLQHLPLPRQWVERFNLLVTLIFALVLIWQGVVLSGRSMGQMAATLPIPMGIIYLAMPVSGLLIAVNTLRMLWRNVTNDDGEKRKREVA